VGQADEFDQALQSELDRRRAWMLEEEERRRRVKEGPHSEDAAHARILKDVLQHVNAKVAHQVKAKTQPDN
jgi:hypothetical protein